MRKLIDIGIDTCLEIDDEGDGPVLILIHGWPVTAFHWRKTLPAFHKAGFRTLMVTLRGLGGQSEGGGNLEKKTLSNETQMLIETLKIKEYALLGHDWGGTVAYLLSHDNPTRCWALVVEEEILPGIDVKIPYPGNIYYPEWHGPFNRTIGLGEKLIPGREADYYGVFLRSSAGKNGLEANALSEYIKAYNRPGQLSYTLGYYRTKEKDVKEIASRLKKPLNFPVLAIGGEFGMGKAVEVGLNFVGKNVHGVIIDEAGHYPAEQNPELFSSEIIKFLKNSLGLEDGIN
jgi:pimeloyl-ACP methyl ester carboxylesterase